MIYKWCLTVHRVQTTVEILPLPCITLAGLGYIWIHIHRPDHIMAQAFHFINDIIRAGLASLKIMPSSYPFLFPPEIKPEQIQEMLDQGVFPTVEGLAPAITYAILLSLARFLLHIFVFKVTLIRSCW